MSRVAGPPANRRPQASPRPGPRPARAGFTLLETLVAVVVLATAMVAVLTVCVNLQDARLRTLRTQAAALTLGDAVADVMAFGPGRLTARQGVRQGAGGDWRWRVDTGGTPFAGTAMVTVTAEPEAGEGGDPARDAADRARQEKRVTVLAGTR